MSPGTGDVFWGYECLCGHVMCSGDVSFCWRSVMCYADVGFAWGSVVCSGDVSISWDRDVFWGCAYW